MVILGMSYDIILYIYYSYFNVFINMNIYVYYKVINSGNCIFILKITYK